MPRKLTEAQEAEQVAARAAAHLELWGEILEVQDAGGKVPCLGAGELDPTAWISDKPAEQEKAAAACESCPALRACSEYVARFKEAGGVWAGQTSKQRGGRW